MTRMPTRTVRRIHFEDFEGVEFERLVFAYLVRAGWKKLEWYGQTGSDQGRDIIGWEPLENGTERRVVVQCVNRDSLSKDKSEKDMAAAVKASGAPDVFKFVCRCNVSAMRRSAIKSTATLLGILQTDTWSGGEFEEHLRLI